VLAAAQRPYAAAAFAATPSGPPAWTTLPCWYLLGTEDKASMAARRLSLLDIGASCWRSLACWVSSAATTTCSQVAAAWAL
jgi:hypothetical protein